MDLRQRPIALASRHRRQAAQGRGGLALAIAIVLVAPAQAQDAQLFASAKAAVSKQLREPRTAVYSDMRAAVAADGSKGVCGYVSAKNGVGGVSGPRHFVYDGKNSHVFVGSSAANNPTTLSSVLIELGLRDAIAADRKYCATR